MIGKETGRLFDMLRFLLLRLRLSQHYPSCTVDDKSTLSLLVFQLLLLLRLFSLGAAINLSDCEISLLSFKESYKTLPWRDFFIVELSS